MAGYIIFIRRKTHGADGMARYGELVVASPRERHGLEMITTRDSKFEIVEGDIEAEFLTMLRFPTIEDARAWYESAEYQEAISLRQAVSDSTVLIMEGAA